MREIWADVVGYEGLYRVSNLGSLRRLEATGRKGTGNYKRPERIIKNRKNNKGYLMVALFRNGEMSQKLLHRIVAEAFIPNPNKLPEVNHKDEDPTNCSVDNLEWCDHKYNMNYGNVRDKIAKANGKAVVQKLKDGTIIKIYPSIIQADRETGVSQGSIGHCVHGRRKTAGGFIWEYEK